MKLKKNNGLLKCTIIGFITACLTFCIFVIRYGGVLIIRDDFNAQQLTFAQAVWNAVHYGNGGEWTWNLDLGSSVLNGFAFYNLGSPFFWIFLALPKGTFPYLVAPLYILKYTVATLTAYIYLRLFTKKEEGKKDNFAIIGALLYAFSGFQAVNLMFFHFHDVVAFFPLLLWGVETIDDKKKRPLFILAIFINCTVNYFFFIQEVIFMVIYFLFRYWKEPVKETLKKMLNTTKQPKFLTLLWRMPGWSQRLDLKTSNDLQRRKSRAETSFRPGFSIVALKSPAFRRNYH